MQFTKGKAYRLDYYIKKNYIMPQRLITLLLELLVVFQY